MKSYKNLRIKKVANCNKNVSISRLTQKLHDFQKSCKRQYFSSQCQNYLRSEHFITITNVVKYGQKILQLFATFASVFCKYFTTDAKVARHFRKIRKKSFNNNFFIFNLEFAALCCKRVFCVFFIN